MNIHERLGKTIEERDQEHVNHLATISLLHRLKSGDVSLDDLVLTPNGWKIKDHRFPPDDNGEAKIVLPEHVTRKTGPGGD